MEDYCTRDCQGKILWRSCRSPLASGAGALARFRVSRWGEAGCPDAAGGLISADGLGVSESEVTGCFGNRPEERGVRGRREHAVLDRFSRTGDANPRPVRRLDHGVSCDQAGILYPDLATI
jgi:hypothetical protein